MTADRKRIIYQGEWERGRMHGRGTFFYSSGVVLNSKQQVVISDDVKGKKKSGSTTSGPVAEAVDSRYDGDFKENLRHGYGKYVLPGTEMRSSVGHAFLCASLFTKLSIRWKVSRKEG